MSELLQQACVEARQGNNTIKQQVRDIGSKFLNNVEISAQEAVYILLQLPMRKASRQVVFINTSPPVDRVELLKSMSDIKNMDDDCDEVYASGLLKRYSNRPAKLENVTLADWAAWYDSCGKPYVKFSNEEDCDNFLVETNVDHNDDDVEINDCSIKENSSKTKKRSKARIIRSCWFNKEAHPEKHFRELIMLFTAWRNEETDLIGISSSYQERYMLLAHVIKRQMEQYVMCNQDFDELQEQVNRSESDMYMYDNIAPCTENVEQKDRAEGDEDLHPDFNETYNLSDDLGIPSVDARTEPLLLNELQNDEYRHMVQMLNKEQKEFFYHVLHLVKTCDQQFYCFF